MAIKRFHIRDAHKRRGGILPARLRFSAHRGVTLVELMIAMLILTLVCTAWLEIIGIQSAKKEARRREAVERLAGMMDAFMYVKKSSLDIQTDGYYVKNVEGRALRFDPVNSRDVHPVFGGGESPIGYQLCIVERTELPKMGLLADVKWGNGCGWLVGRLYERTGLVGEVGKPFFTLSVNTGVELIW